MNQRLRTDQYQMDVEGLRAGEYSDAYFVNQRHLLKRLAEEGYSFSQVPVGDSTVEMQIFTRRRPFSVVAGVDEALAILYHATGGYRNGGFVNTFDELESVEAVEEGSIVPHEGGSANVRPVLRIRGRYRDFAVLETPILGVLTETTRIATNVFHLLEATGGKGLLFFPARFSHYKVQSVHGHAYKTAVDAYNRVHGASLKAYISTDMQGAWWGGKGSGTMSHSLIACFQGSTEEAIMQFARVLDPGILRVALVDFHNDCIGTTRAVMRTMWQAWWERTRKGDEEGARRYRLFGVRPDTAGDLRDRSLEPLGDPKLDCGVNGRLIWRLREAINAAYRDWSLSPEDEAIAKSWCQEVKIIATGGFTAEKIRDFERSGVPVDMYGVGSSTLSNCSACGTRNDFTADIVRIKVDNRWIPCAKVGRAPADNDQLQLIHRRTATSPREK